MSIVGIPAAYALKKSLEGQGSISQRNVHDLAALLVFTMYLYKLNRLPSVIAFPFSRVFRLLFVTYFGAAIWVGKYIGVNNIGTPNTTTIKNNRRHSHRCISTPDAQTDHGTSCLTGIGGVFSGGSEAGA
jgi:hypothetical protein